MIAFFHPVLKHGAKPPAAKKGRERPSASPALHLHKIPKSIVGLLPPYHYCASCEKYVSEIHKKREGRIGNHG
jgi:hypothetical protein